MKLKSVFAILLVSALLTGIYYTRQSRGPADANEAMLQIEKIAPNLVNGLHKSLDELLAPKKAAERVNCGYLDSKHAGERSTVKNALAEPQTCMANPPVLATKSTTKVSDKTVLKTNKKN